MSTVGRRQLGRIEVRGSGLGERKMARAVEESEPFLCRQKGDRETGTEKVWDHFTQGENLSLDHRLESERF